MGGRPNVHLSRAHARIAAETPSPAETSVTEEIGKLSAGAREAFASSHRSGRGANLLATANALCSSVSRAIF